ncbi:MAG: biotin--[acetyl-CoA-carboxylase] ligase [Clostridia bacterium]|nr:biotin--[acetyl-CoA-carboxylase] ligase [Clostridia bacterium]
MLENLETDFIGRKEIFYKEIDSTQKEIWRRIENKKIEDGTIIIADIQNNAIGTHGRVWYTDEESNIAFSIYLKSNCRVSNLNGITIEIAQILVNIFKDKYNIKLEIKEPNDLVVNNKKIGGILTETKLNGETAKYMVIGIGINTNKTKFNKEICDIASSIKKEFGIQVDRQIIIEEFCNQFEKNYKEKIEK